MHNMVYVLSFYIRDFHIKFEKCENLPYRGDHIWLGMCNCKIVTLFLAPKLNFQKYIEKTIVIKVSRLPFFKNVVI